MLIVKDGKAVEQTVITGRRGNGRLEIVVGLAAGDLVGSKREDCDPAGR